MHPSHAGSLHTPRAITSPAADRPRAIHHDHHTSPLAHHLSAWSTAQAVWELFPGVVDLQLNMMLHANSPEAQVHTQESLLQTFIEILGAPTALERATIRWNPEDEIMGMLHGLDSPLRRAVPGLRSLYLDGGSRLPCTASWDLDISRH
ncbi:hypothetical protein B0H13DRAFT_2654317 [Mycena leptocephala]|nr:hypothetical protein B0H13DRAFT_2654317 [Mycena leptocephala]